MSFCCSIFVRRQKKYEMTIKKTEEEDKDEKRERPHACTKSELALRYLPHVTAAAARRTLRQWIEKNKELKEALIKSGYTENSRLLTLAQIQLHYDYLGEP